MHSWSCWSVAGSAGSWRQPPAGQPPAGQAGSQTAVEEQQTRPDFTTRVDVITMDVIARYILLAAQKQMAIDDHEKLAREFPLYDALYVYCGGTWPVPKPTPRV